MVVILVYLTHRMKTSLELSIFPNKSVKFGKEKRGFKAMQPHAVWQKQAASDKVFSVYRETRNPKIVQCVK